jgi:hypothetical protein
MALFIFRNINFIVPEYLTEDEFIRLKKGTVDNQSPLPSFLKFHLQNIAIVVICILALLINQCFPNNTTELMSTVGKILLVFWIPKIFIETYKFIKFKIDEKVYYKKLNFVLNASSYAQFRLDYDNEIIKSKFGKWLIKTLKK